MAKMVSFSDEIAGCSKANKDKKITLKDKKSKCIFCIENSEQKNLSVINVDHCIQSLKDKEKCDYCVELPGSKAHYVELKGKKLDKAISQLKATLGHFKSHHEDLEKSCYAVVTAVPKMRTGIQNVKLTFRKTTNVPLYVSTMKHTLTI